MAKPDYFDAFRRFVASGAAPLTTVPVSLGKVLPGAVFYNTEQLTREAVLRQFLEDISRDKPPEVWDYSKVNVEILAKHGVQARHVPLKCPKDYLKSMATWRAAGITHDVGFCGTLTRRRVDILEALRKGGCRVLLSREWGEDRDRQLAGCHMILNVHAGADYKVFESARCEQWLSLGVPVFSETSLDDDPRANNFSYEALVPAVLTFMRLLRHKQGASPGASQR